VYKTILVDTDIEDGRSVVSELEKRRLPITAAFWLHFEDEDDWKLVVVSPEVSEQGPRQLYATVFSVLNTLGNHSPRVQFAPDQVRLVSPYSLLYKMIKQRAGPVGGPVREGPVLDAYIYKME
jgi:hypothetical protein